MSGSFSREGIVTTGSEPLDVGRAHDEHAEFVWKTLHRMGVSEADLPDLLQEVFITVHRRRGSFDGSSAMRTWLYGICLRLVANHRRKLGRRREMPVAHVPDGADPELDPEQQVLERHARRTVHRLLDALEPDRRAVFVMFEVEGLSCPAIAEMLGIPLGTVYSRLRAARDDFARALSRHRARERRQS